MWSKVPSYMARLPAIAVPSADSSPQLDPEAQDPFPVAPMQEADPVPLFVAANWKMPAHPPAPSQAALAEVLESSPTKTYTSSVVESTMGLSTMPVVLAAAVSLLLVQD